MNAKSSFLDKWTAIINREPKMKTTSGLIARPLAEWHEDMGDVLWWKFPIAEAPYVGSPLDLGYTVEISLRASDGTEKMMRESIGGWPGYHTHWTPIERPESGEASEPEPMLPLIERVSGVEFVDQKIHMLGSYHSCRFWNCKIICDSDTGFLSLCDFKGCEIVNDGWSTSQRERCSFERCSFFGDRWDDGLPAPAEAKP